MSILRIDPDRMAVGVFRLIIALQMTRQQIAEFVPGRGELWIDTDRMAVGILRLIVALKMIRQQNTEVVPGSGEL